VAKYERLLAWQASHELAKAVYAATRTFPRSELYGITSQMRKAALSVPTNIVEGAARKGSLEFRRFLDISWASLAELRYHVLFSHEMGFLSAGQRVELERLGVRAAKLLWGLHETVTRRAKES
jgi:four helix bundle protein